MREAIVGSLHHTVRVEGEQLYGPACGSMLRRQGTRAAVLPRRRDEGEGRRQGGVQAEGERLRGRCGEGDLSWLHAEILGEAGPCVVKDRSRASSLGVAAVRIADAGALEFGHHVHDLWERRRSRRVIQEESGWRHRTKATGTPAFRRGGPHHGVGRSRSAVACAGVALKGSPQ